MVSDDVNLHPYTQEIVLTQTDDEYVGGYWYVGVSRCKLDPGLKGSR